MFFVVFDKTFYDTNHWLIVLHACDDIIDMSDAIHDRLKITQFSQNDQHNGTLMYELVLRVL